MYQAIDRGCEPKANLRVALVYPPFDDKRERSAYYVAPPLGLLYLASYLERDGHAVSILDFIFELKSGRVEGGRDLYRTCAEMISQLDPDVVCFSTQCTTSPGSVNIARRLKVLNPQLTIVFGGHDVSFVAEDYLTSFPEIDFILAGEAEASIGPLMQAIAAGAPPNGIPGLFWRASPDVQQNAEAVRPKNLDLLLPPAYHLVPPLKEYFALSRSPTILIDSGRGCAFECEFCQTTLLNGNKVRYRSVDSLIAELTAFKNAHGIYEAYFVHDLFTARRAFVEELCNKLISADLGLSWQCRCRLDQVDTALLKLMSRAGCRMLLYGVESGSPDTLRRMNKKYRTPTPRQILERVRWTIEAGIFPSLSMVVGTPEESLDDLSATMELAHQFLRLGSVNAFIQLMSPLPGTALAKRLRDRFTYQGEAAPTAFSQGIEFDGGYRLPEDEQLIADYPGIFQSFQVVVPDHGDIDVCVDVSLIYCKLMEIYQRTFSELLRISGFSHLELFTSWRDEWLALRDGTNLSGVRDFEIWTSFEGYVERHFLGTDPPLSLSEAFRFERCLRDVSENPPVTRQNGDAFLPLGLSTRTHLFQTEALIDGWGQEGQRGLKRSLIFASPDRLHIVPLDDETYELFEIACDPIESLRLSQTSASRLLQHFSSLISKGALVSTRYLARMNAETACDGVAAE